MVVDGLWIAAPAALFFLDLLWPATTRTLFQFFHCRRLGELEVLEADYSIDCNGQTYKDYYQWVGFAAVAYAGLVPALFMYLMHRFQDRGLAGDKVVSAALGWAYEPFRYGTELVQILQQHIS